jgi:hypothetical protein
MTKNCYKKKIKKRRIGVCYKLQLLKPKGPSPFFGPFLEFGQAIVDGIFVHKVSNFCEHVVQY